MSMATLERDEDLLVAWQTGQAGAFDELYARHAPSVLGYLLAMMKNREAAEEALQHVFIGFLGRMKALPRETNVRAFLFASARNRVATIARESERGERFTGTYEVLVRRRADALPASPLELEETRMKLNAGLRQISEHEREVILLRCQGELTFEQIATVTGAPLGTVATRYQAGIRKMRDYLKHG